MPGSSGFQMPACACTLIDPYPDASQHAAGTLFVLVYHVDRGKQTRVPKQADQAVQAGLPQKCISRLRIKVEKPNLGCMPGAYWYCHSQAQPSKLTTLRQIGSNQLSHHNTNAHRLPAPILQRV